MNYQEEKEHILARIMLRVADEEEAEAWFHQQYIPALGCTAHEALRTGRFDALNNFLSIVEVGGYA